MFQNFLSPQMLRHFLRRQIIDAKISIIITQPLQKHGSQLRESSVGPRTYYMYSQNQNSIKNATQHKKTVRQHRRILLLASRIPVVFERNVAPTPETMCCLKCLASPKTRLLAPRILRWSSNSLYVFPKPEFRQEMLHSITYGPRTV